MSLTRPSASLCLKQRAPSPRPSLSHRGQGETAKAPPGFGLRQSFGAFRSGLAARKRQGTAALQDAIATAHPPPRFMVMPAAKRNRALHEPAEAPPGFGLRQSSGAFRSGLAARKRQGTAALQDAIATAHPPPRFMVMPAAKRNRALHEPAEAPPGFGLRQPSGAFRSGLAAQKSSRGLPHSKTLSRRRIHLRGSWSQCLRKNERGLFMK